MSPVTIGIIGGTGGMGRLFEKIFVRAGHRVLVAGRKTDLSYVDLALQSDVVILSTPIESALAICDEIGPHMGEHQALMDFCSLKEDIVQKMLSCTGAEVVGTHPMFGPFTESLNGQNIILCPGRGEKWFQWIEKEFKKEGSVVSTMEPKDHDRTMAVAQGLTHFLTICMGRTLQKLDMSPSQAGPYSTPIFKLKNDLIGRLFAQDLHLYAMLVGGNHYVKDVLDLFLASVNEGREALLSGDTEHAVDFLQSIRDFLGDFCDVGLSESNKIMRSVVCSEKQVV
ncbi:MAG: prephenate dehydrogenase/arogenate dehydrogenase family protein [Proteobacteria bacterium]|nr:prephenate dehydrogenase/arogenate dehydrogenase family protein [Pseudomonadota bacterium]